MKKEKVKQLYRLLEEMLSNAPREEDCSDLENEIYADCQNLKESLARYRGAEDTADCSSEAVNEVFSECMDGTLKAYAFRNEKGHGIQVDYIPGPTEHHEFAFIKTSVMQIENGVILTRFEDNYGYGKEVVMGMEYPRK